MFKCEIRISDISVYNYPTLCGSLKSTTTAQVASQDYNLYQSVIIKNIS